jgi:putative ABC transport system permease protein
MGRNFSAREAKAASNICLIGKEIKTKLFKNNKIPVGESIMVGAAKYRVVGFEERGTVQGFVEIEWLLFQNECLSEL